MKLSIVSTLYNSAPHLEEFYRRASEAAGKLVEEDFEIVLVNDGSPDNSLEAAKRLAEADDHVVVIDLSRNFGHHQAIMTGLAHVQGDRVFLIDSDLEEDPEWLLSFAEQMDKEKCDVVYGVQVKRKGGWFERWSGEFYYWTVNWLLDLNHPKNITTVRLMTKSFVEALLLHKEREIVISGLWMNTGFKQQAQTVTKKSSSETTYSLLHKLSHFVNVVTSFSSRPLIFIFFTGLVIFSVSVMYALVLILNKLLFEKAIDGWTSLMVSVWSLGGMIILFIGIIGIYISKIFMETKRRPLAIVKGIYGRTTE